MAENRPRGNAAELLVRCLENEGVEYIFGLPGEEIVDVLDALSRSSQIRLVVTRHEQGAAFMADVYGRVSTYPGVCLATLGPGATNLITGIADANLDRAPLVAITGQAGLERVHKESHQYLDVVQMLQPITKWNARVARAETLPEMVRKAFRLARLEKPGATHLELPEDVAAEPVDPAIRPLPVRRTTYPAPTPATLEAAAEQIAAAQHPVVLAGNGVIRREASGHDAAAGLAAFARTLDIPVLPTFMGNGALDARDALAGPAVGLQRPGADLALHPVLAAADLVITAGYDLVEWAPALWNPNRDKTIIHVDSTPAEIDGHYLPAVEVVGEIGAALSALAALCAEQPRRRPARRALAAHPYESLRAFAGDPSVPMKPQRVVWELRAALGESDILISDVGAHKLWLASYYPAYRPNTLIISNGLATMGLAVPGGLAARLAHPTRRVVAVSGDGGFLMNSQELETAQRLRVPYVNVVWMDARYGVIELNQQRRLGRTFGVEFGNPDLVGYARSFGLPAWQVAQADDFLPLLQRALDLDGPSLIVVPIDARENQRLGQPAAAAAE
jgi:acetolactate synthase I/II/III large subunit